MPQVDTAVRESFAPHQEENNPVTPEQPGKQNTELPARPSTVKAVPPEHRSKPKNNAAMDVSEKDPDPVVAPTVHEKQPDPAGMRLPEQHFKAPDQTVRAAQEMAEPSVFDARPSGDAAAHIVEPHRTVLTPIERELPVISARPAAKIDAAPSAQENSQAPQVEPRFINAQQAEGGSSLRTPEVTRPVVENRPLANTVRPGPDSTPVLKPVLTAQPVPVISRPAGTQPQPGLEQESVVQIHIGRIEVRAVMPPAAPRAAQAAASQPRMSLDDYLRRREEKQ